MDQSNVLQGDDAIERTAALIEYYGGRETFDDGQRLRALVTEQWKLIHYVGEPFGELYDLTADSEEFRK